MPGKWIAQPNLVAKTVYVSVHSVSLSLSEVDKLIEDLRIAQRQAENVTDAHAAASLRLRQWTSGVSLSRPLRSTAN